MLSKPFYFSFCIYVWILLKIHPPLPSADLDLGCLENVGFSISSSDSDPSDPRESRRLR